MHIELRNQRREHLFAVEVNLSDPPAIVHDPAGGGQAVHLNWDRAIDDEQHLRRCPVCGCADLFKRKPLPQLTAFAIVVLAAVVAMLVHGIGDQPMLALAVFLAVSAVDIAIYLFTPRQLVCYNCRSAFSSLRIRRDHPRWDKTLGDQYPPPDERDNADENNALNHDHSVDEEVDGYDEQSDEDDSDHAAKRRLNRSNGAHTR